MGQRPRPIIGKHGERLQIFFDPPYQPRSLYFLGRVPNHELFPPSVLPSEKTDRLFFLNLKDLGLFHTDTPGGRREAGQ